MTLRTPASPTQAGMMSALKDVVDPEFGVSIVDMGLIVDSYTDAGAAHVKVTFTAMGCPAMDMIIDDIRERLLQEPGVKEVEIEIVWDPVWTPDRLTAEGRMALHMLGIAV